MIYLAIGLSVLLIASIAVAIFEFLMLRVSARWIAERDKEIDLLKQENATLEFLREKSPEAWAEIIE